MTRPAPPACQELRLGYFQRIKKLLRSSTMVPRQACAPPWHGNSQSGLPYQHGWIRVRSHVRGSASATSGGEPEIAVQPDASLTWLERPCGGQVLTEALMRISQQTQLSCDRL
jgi:hypothetical protein